MFGDGHGAQIAVGFGEDFAGDALGVLRIGETQQRRFFGLLAGCSPD